MATLNGVATAVLNSVDRIAKRRSPGTHIYFSADSYKRYAKAGLGLDQPTFMI